MEAGYRLACPEALRGALASQRDALERIFRVALTVGAASGAGRVWLRLRGADADVKAAEVFVRGLVKQERQQEMSYPAALHCIFRGARGLFVDCMIKSTSAHIAVSSPGLLLISGLTVPVVRAYSLIADLLERYAGGRRDDSHSTRRAFEALVEKRQDRHLPDLSALPGAVKGALLDLVKESGLAPDPEAAAAPVAPHDPRPPGEKEAGEEERPEPSDPRELSPAGRDFGLFLKFFTAMGYTEEVVKRVLGRTGLKEASRILDLVQQEQDSGDGERWREREPPCETGERNRTAAGGGGARAGAAEEERDEEDDGGAFVLGVLKKAAVSCGYAEQKVSEACGGALPDGSGHLLLLELQKDAARKGKPQSPSAEVGEGGARAAPGHPPPDPPEGAPGPTGPPPLPRVPPPSADRRKASRSPPAAGSGERLSSAGVTGRQRFLEALRTPFRLRLSDRPGDPELRTVIVDGSNVAMSHGLGHFFSCRGIALAVEHFWERGHRHISALLPQWRQKSDPRIREQHYLGQLQELGLLSFTPSREVLGTRISCYDDRLMLQLAQKTDGVIVTNDNLRDLLDESDAWRDIVSKRLLQYTFVGDLFMVPDDPLGRGGPRLDDFLRAERSTAEAGRPLGPRTAARDLPERAAPGRTAEATAALRERLRQVFPGRDGAALRSNPAEDDLNALSPLLLER